LARLSIPGAARITGSSFFILVFSRSASSHLLHVDVDHSTGESFLFKSIGEEGQVRIFKWCARSSFSLPPIIASCIFALTNLRAFILPGQGRIRFMSYLTFIASQWGTSFLSPSDLSDPSPLPFSTHFATLARLLALFHEYSDSVGLYIDSELAHGSTARSLTFANEPLASESKFEVLGLEVWGIGGGSAR
jgi:hypothetical protein